MYFNSVCCRTAYLPYFLYLTQEELLACWVKIQQITFWNSFLIFPRKQSLAFHADKKNTFSLQSAEFAHIAIKDKEDYLTTIVE